MSSIAENAKAIFLEAVERHSPEGWAEFLDQACGENRDLRGRVEGLLQAHAEQDSLFDRLEATRDYQPLVRPDQMIGPYKIREQIGDGGMGVVYVAEQEKPLRRKVALKVIKPGMDSKAVLARFDAERNALALMNHPNIAKVLDAGTTEQGRPYFVMELIQGKPVTDYCDQKKLTIQTRLELFTQICNAVQHAHQKGVIHRDIKPTNILVTEIDGKPVPKVIDFGIAKALGANLTDRTVYTSFQSLVGTPLYMSPEQTQLSGVDVDTSSDVYSLGILLYELLTGTTPLSPEELRQAAQDEVLRRIRETEPPRPSNRISSLGETSSQVSECRSAQPEQLGRLVQGDLDWIVMKALEKDRNRRYKTADAFAADIGRHLTNEPVEARPPSTAYRISRFYRRKKVAVQAAATVVVLLFVGMAGILASLVYNIHLGKKLRAVNYARTMTSAFAAWQNSNPEQALRMLEKLASDQQLEPGMEWGILKHQIEEMVNDPSGQKLGDTFKNCQISFSHDGSLLAIPVPERGVRLYEVETGQESWLLSEDERDDGMRALSAAFSPKQKLLVVGMGRQGEPSGALHVFDLEANIHRSANLPLQVWSITFSPEGDQIAILNRGQSTDHRIESWDIQSLEEIWTSEELEFKPRSVAFHPDGKHLLLTHDDAGMTLWDRKTGEQQTAEFAGNLKKFQTAGIQMLPDGKTMVTSGESERIYWHLESYQPFAIESVEPGHIGLALSSQHPRILASKRNRCSIDVQDWDTGEHLRTIQDEIDIQSFVITANGSHLATLSLAGQVKLWKLFDNKHPSCRYSNRWFVPMQVIGNGAVVLPGHGGRVKIWHPQIGHDDDWDRKDTRQVSSFAFSCDGLLAIGSFADRGKGLVQIWDPSDRSLRWKSDFQAGSVWSVAFSKKGKTLAVGGDNGTIELYQLPAFKLLKRIALESTETVRSLSFSSDERYLVSGSGTNESGKITLWDMQSFEAVCQKLRSNRVDSVSFAPDGHQFAAADRAGFVQLWNTENLEKPVFDRKSRGSYVASVRFNTKGDRLVCAAIGDIIIYRVSDGEEVARWKTPETARAVAIFDDDSAVLSAGQGLARIWPADPTTSN